ncbi:uncharacterized protein RHIMIDRAFT_290383 [Rhizopus microsporus ATCC 52813]|uniref:SPX domain-containing protein n=2 Tax=Rhizopus microsporus TaxID=58291 RepID=A0A2G4T142_RHIZD|nr:uncharacterized protein RHIMIDRAFT_290383 [Rhizopus microsporus ATCC 52813]PHZ14729.1 hypothetical protein RHIMIDRAFT_290383 [Rhizopus microsporus ATCC 52813]
MKFGDNLKGKIHVPWESFYIEYNELKHEMKRRQMEHGWNATDEAEYRQKIENELIKVHQFIDNSLGDLNKRILHTEVMIRELMMSTETKQRYDDIADTLTEILFDCNDLSKFLCLNATGFDKLNKKHDKHTRIEFSGVFRKELLSRYSLDRLSLQVDILIVKISELIDICRLHGNPRNPQDKNLDDQTAFERATAKFWIHPDYITEVKSVILFHLPVHVFNQKKQYEEGDMAVSSVYFDNKQFDLYLGRVEREAGAEAIRLRWYGDNEDDVYVERKTHKAAWLDGKSVKDRFKLKQTLINDYLAGRYTADDLVEDLRMKANGKARSETVLEENHFVASGIQESVKAKELEPMCRVFYNRTAFQLPGDQRLRISIDSNLTFIREDGSERRQFIGPKQLHWKRKDVGIDYPFNHVVENDISRFPYAILETKLQTHLGQECPAWLTALLDSHLVFEAPRFSKYIHGAATLFKGSVPIQPFWMQEFDKDIRRRPTGNYGLSRSQSFKPLVNGHHRASLLLLYEREMQRNARKKNRSLINLFSITGSFKKRNAKQDQPQQDPSSKPGQPVSPTHMTIDVSEIAMSKTYKDFVNRFQNVSTPILTGSFLKRGRSNKRTSPLLPRARSSQLSKKAEPKTFFANERTFISWLQFCALLLTVALNLLNYGDLISRGIGATFIIIGAALCIYALIRYQIRSWQLRTNLNLIRYDDIWGPTVLCILLVVALIVNFYLRFETLSPSYHQKPSQ